MSGFAGALVHGTEEWGYITLAESYRRLAAGMELQLSHCADSESRLA
jgi:hypothetical protein